jgi:NAD(P)H-nitrite reductase large subunit
MVCPFGVRPDPATDRVVRCDVCSDRDIPACVSACPTGALGTEPEPDRRARSEFAGHVVVVGSSAAGIAACEAAREHAPRCAITLVTADEFPHYSRPLLAYFLAGRIRREEIDWRDNGYLERDLGVRILQGRRADQLKVGANAIVLDDGTELGFDRLIVATGARGARLTVAGAELDGVFTLRNLDDMEGLEQRIQAGRRAVVLGGGNVGLQAAEALLARGMKVSIVVASSYPLSQMVDAEAGGRVTDLFARNGTDVRTGSEAVEIEGASGVEGVRLSNGDVIATDLVVVGKGIRPNIEWLQGSGVRIGRGIVADVCGRTNLSGVFAAGDCAEMPDPLTGRLSVSGIWPVAYEMGRAAGSTAVGIERASAGALRLNASRFFCESIISIGEVCPERLDGGTAEILANRNGVYRKLVYQRGRVAGALLYGDISDAGVYYRLYRENRT